MSSVEKASHEHILQPPKIKRKVFGSNVLDSRPPPPSFLHTELPMEDEEQLTPLVLSPTSLSPKGEKMDESTEGSPARHRMEKSFPRLCNVNNRPDAVNESPMKKIARRKDTTDLRVGPFGGTKKPQDETVFKAPSPVYHGRIHSALEKEGESTSTPTVRASFQRGLSGGLSVDIPSFDTPTSGKMEEMFGSQSFMTPPTTPRESPWARSSYTHGQMERERSTPTLAPFITNATPTSAHLPTVSANEHVRVITPPPESEEEEQQPVQNVVKVMGPTPVIPAPRRRASISGRTKVCPPTPIRTPGRRRASISEAMLVPPKNMLQDEHGFLLPPQREEELAEDEESCFVKSPLRRGSRPSPARPPAAPMDTSVSTDNSSLHGSLGISMGSSITSSVGSVARVVAQGFQVNPFGVDVEERTKEAEYQKEHALFKRVDLVEKYAGGVTPQRGIGFATGRFAEDFEVIGVLGRGSFGVVYHARHRLDGCDYAVKRTQRQIRGENDLQAHLQEVFALSAVESCPNLLRYYSSWLEDDHLCIQMELCDGGSVEHQVKSGRQFSELDIREMVRQSAEGLRMIHARGLVHLDVKPENIYVTRDGVYKIGDMGLVTFAEQEGERSSIMEGDNRYLAPEVLQEDYGQLKKADVFALGMAAYEVASGRELPTQGKEWVAIRETGKLGPVPGISPMFHQLLEDMIHPRPERRPTTDDLVMNSVLCSICPSSGDRTPTTPVLALDDMRRQLQIERARRLTLEATVADLRKRLESSSTSTLAKPMKVDASGPIPSSKPKRKVVVKRKKKKGPRRSTKAQSKRYGAIPIAV